MKYADDPRFTDNHTGFRKNRLRTDQIATL